MFKRGEISSEAVVGGIIVILTLVILVVFIAYGALKANAESERELCHLSVIARGTSEHLVGINTLPSLECTADKICFSESGKDNECEQLAGYKTRGVKLDLDESEEAVNLLEKEIANSMYFCWQMMGEGKLDLWGRFSVFQEEQTKCLVCSRLAIDRDLWNNPKFQERIMNNVDVNEYLSHERPDDSVSKTYLQLLTDVGVAAPGKEITGIGAGEPKDQLSVLFAQRKTDVSPGEAALGVLKGGVLLYGGIQAGELVTTGGILTASVKRTVIGIIASVIGIGSATALAGYKTHQGQVASLNYCGEFLDDKKEAKLGCSTVSVIEWDTNKINELCKGGIEGNL